MGNKLFKRLFNDKLSFKRSPHFVDALEELPTVLSEKDISPIPVFLKPRLPLELILYIVELSRHSIFTLKSLALVNRAISQYALQLIWREISVGLTEKHPVGSTRSSTKPVKTNTNVNMGMIKNIKSIRTSRKIKKDMTWNTRDQTRIINCYFNNYTYLNRINLIGRKNKQFKNLRTLKIHLNSIKGISGKNGCSTRSSISEDIISKNYARKLPTNFDKLIFIGLPDSFYRDYSNVDSGSDEEPEVEGLDGELDTRSARKPKIKSTLKNLPHPGPSKLIFIFKQGNNEVTNTEDNLIKFIKEIYRKAKVPNLKELNIIFLLDHVNYSQNKILRLRQDFSLFKLDLIDLLSYLSYEYPPVSVKLVNFNCLDSVYLGISSFPLNDNNNNEGEGSIYFKTLQSDQDSHQVNVDNDESINEYIKNQVQTEARKLHVKILDDIPLVKQKPSSSLGRSNNPNTDSGESMETFKKQRMMTLRQYLKEEDWEDELEWEDVEYYL
ncbi:uncharacterized protein L201_001837 [Kwoniella dendrophila CBS 6074]|uniref:F-box domain-containing protein n=1 Tax=Kwoniella dendrophila CBS 6074 TaxID=1295534 RepID=A0AAX4JNG4_9TREE